MQELLKIACLQVDIQWVNPVENLKYYAESIEKLISEVHLVILPEMFSTGFSMQPENCAETMDGLSVSWMKEIALKRNLAVMGSLVIIENNNYYNRLVFVNLRGELEYYDKRHLFTLAGEDQVYTSGNEKIIIEYLGWKIRPLICYDLRFPVWSRNNDDYDLLVYIANWPKPRIIAWDTLLRARAIENLSYVIGVNRVGSDANNLEYIGHTQIINPLGEVINSSIERQICIVETSINKTTLLEIREKLQFSNDKDSFSFDK